MARIFGYLSLPRGSDFASAAATYAARQMPDVQGLQSGADERQATSRPVARCYAPELAESNGLLIGVAGNALWNGMSIAGSDRNQGLERLGDYYRNTGPGFLSELEGPFALAVLDTDNRRALIAIDRMGIERMVYAQGSAGLTFGTSANAVANFPGESSAIRNQAFYDFLIFHMVAAPNTVYRDVAKLPPATALLFENGHATLDRYWSPSYEYAGRGDFSRLKSELHAGLEMAVAASGPDESTGAFLSGGLDSSSIVGKLAGVSEAPAKTFTVGFGETEYDELQFARVANRHFGCEAFEYHMVPGDIVDAFPRIAAAYDEPFGNSSAAPTYFCAKLAADNGVTHLLAGDGGDELFAGNERYVRQWIFDLYNQVPQILRTHFVEPASRLISPDSVITPFRKLRSYVDQAMIPLPERFESWNLTYREGSSRMLDRDFANTIDKNGPLQQMRNVWDASPSENLLERMLWYDWHFTLADNDLRKVGTMCELAGVRVSYPMLHSKVVNLSTRIPPKMKIEGTELRSFFKKSMSDYLPSEILDKKKHGFGLPFGLWLGTDQNLADLIYSHLTDLKSRRIIASEFIDELIKQHRTGHASYYGYAIWDLAMLEVWMAHHIDNAVLAKSAASVRWSIRP